MSSLYVEFVLEENLPLDNGLLPESIFLLCKHTLDKRVLQHLQIAQRIDPVCKSVPRHGAPHGEQVSSALQISAKLCTSLPDLFICQLNAGFLCSVLVLVTPLQCSNEAAKPAQTKACKAASKIPVHDLMA